VPRLSTLLDNLDSYDSSDRESLKVQLLACQSALDWIDEAALPLASDSNISKRVDRFRLTFKEMESLTNEIHAGQPQPATPSLDGDGCSTTSESSGPSTSIMHRTPPRARTLSSPSSKIPILHMTKRRAPPPPLPRRPSAQSLTDVFNLPTHWPKTAPSTATLPRSSSGPIHSSKRSMSVAMDPQSMQRRFSSRSLSSFARARNISSSIPPRQITPNRKFKPSKRALDQAVANIVNDLPTSVSIQRQADDNDTDLSGRYVSPLPMP
jgi:hypothetical protein